MQGTSRPRREVAVLSLRLQKLVMVCVLVALPLPALAGHRKGKNANRKAKAEAKVEVKPDVAAEPETTIEAEEPAAEEEEAAQGTPVGEDALRLGPFVAPPKPFPFPLLGEERQKEVFVDRDGKLYRDRPYSGQVPDWNNEVSSSPTGRCRVEPQTMTWVGFQNTADASRVYVQLEHDACGYVYRPDDGHIVIDLPMVAVLNPNLRREILTGAFPTPIDYIRAEDLGGKGTRIVISLKEKRSYLSAHLGRYVFVDIPR